MKSLIDNYYFISFTEDGDLHWSGKILGEVQSYFLVVLFSALDGYETHRFLASAEEVSLWKLYPTEGIYEEEYQKHYARLTRKLAQSTTESNVVPSQP